MVKGHILDPLWITKGSSDLDPEYYTYILLAANKKYREKLEAGDISDFYEIFFHSLNLNNLAVDGSLFDFHMNPIWNDPRLKEIRNNLRKLYQLPKNLVEIFKNANMLFVGLLIDYLDAVIEYSDDVKLYFVNKGIHREKEIFILLNKEKELEYDVWKLRYDKRYRFGHKLTHVETLQLDSIRDNALSDAIDKSDNKDIKKMDANINVMFGIYDEDKDPEKVAKILSNVLLFNKGIPQDLRFEPHIFNEIFEILNRDRVIPFAMSSWT